jgi:hypothetical protein
MPPLRLVREEAIQSKKVHSRHGRDVVDIGLSNHGRHCLVNVALAKLILAVLVPYCFEVKVGAIEKRLQKCCTSRMCDSCASLVVVFASGTIEQDSRRGASGPAT